ncbi:MAG: hypothetical protein LBO69_09880 [Ignavibacteria bacterium]|jgi:beta-glucosidase|nr:hypothetical protein [Ignavibacteria bacterium]
MAKFSHWSNAKLAAQCVFPRLDVEQYRSDDAYRTNINDLVHIGCGGFCIFNGSVESVKQTTDELQMFAETPLLFCSDFENGLQMRLEDGTSFPHSMALQYAETYTKQVAQAIAKEAKDIGVYWNLAPVCDINSNPKNPVINIRSFGENKDIVSKHIRQYIDGTQAECVVGCAKHFPGHGDTATDSHTSFPVLLKMVEELEESDIVPFVAAIEQGVKSIMLGHLVVPSLDERLPMSLSPSAVSYVRNRLNYNGVILTDGLDMHSITDAYSSSEIAEMAIKAGNDVLLIPPEPMDVIATLERLLAADEDLVKQVVFSVERIYKLKQFAKLIPQFAKPSAKVKLFSEHLQLALRVAVAATRAEGKGIAGATAGMLPDDEPYAAFSIVQKSDDIQAASRFFTMLAGATENDCNYAYLDENISDDELSDMVSGVADATFVIFALFYRGRGYSQSLASAEQINRIIARLSDGREAIVIFFGDPYISNEIATNTKILTYSDSFASLAAAVMQLTGRKLE